MGAPATILCVDDEEPVLFTQQAMLQAAGFRVFTARSGVEALSIFETEPVDVVLMDYWMTGMNGITAARRMKALRPEVPIVFLSAYAELLDEALGVAQAWIKKGEEEPEHLVARLSALAASASPT
jgi:CheY-like chemotaxis protein